MEFSRLILGPVKECRRCGTVLSSARRTCNGEDFLSQFNVPKRPLLNEQMAQWAELHKVSGAAMKEVVVRLWPTEPIPNSYFGLVQRLVDAMPRIDAVKRSACIEGAQMALICPRQDVLGEDEAHRYCSVKSTRGQGPSHARALF